MRDQYDRLAPLAAYLDPLDWRFAPLRVLLGEYLSAPSARRWRGLCLAGRQTCLSEALSNEESGSLLRELQRACIAAGHPELEALLTPSPAELAGWCEEIAAQAEAQAPEVAQALRLLALYSRQEIH